MNSHTWPYFKNVACLFCSRAYTAFTLNRKATLAVRFQPDATIFYWSAVLRASRSVVD